MPVASGDLAVRWCFHHGRRLPEINKLDDLMSHFFCELGKYVNTYQRIISMTYCSAFISCLPMPGVLHFLRNDFNGFLDVAKPMRISGSPFMVRRSSSLVEGGGPDLWKSDPQRQSYLDFLVIRSVLSCLECFVSPSLSLPDLTSARP